MNTIEILEARIAPANVTIAGNGHSASYTDVDGDHVTVAVSKGVLTPLDFTTTPGGLGFQLELIDLSGGGFDGANLTVSVKKAPGGDGLANIGYIDSTGHNLGAVAIPGDLGRIDVGDESKATPGLTLKSLSVDSLGRLGTDTQAPGGTLTSLIGGPLGILKVKHDLTEADFTVVAASLQDGTIKTITVGGSIIGGSTPNSGAISATGQIGSVKIGGDLQGGAGARSGTLASVFGISTLTIGGSLLGGSGMNSGADEAQEVGSVKIGHDVLGGTGSGSAVIVNGTAAVKIGGSVIGGPGSGSAVIQSEGLVTIGHDLEGGSGANSGTITGFSGATLGGATVGGSVIGGSGASSGAISGTGGFGPIKIGGSVFGGSASDSGSIIAADDIARVTIGGSLYGGTASGTGYISGNALGAVKIAHDVVGGSGIGSGSIACSGATDVSGMLASLAIGGSLIGGSGTGSGSIGAIASIGPVSIGHNLVGSSISGTTASLDQTGSIESSGGRIASVSIGGSIIAGSDGSTAGSLTNNASIRAATDLGSLTVKGNIVGNTGSAGSSPVIISAVGQDVAIGHLTVGGRVEQAQILAGYDPSLTATNADAQIATVKVGGDWVASSLVAGAIVGPDGIFGASDNSKPSGAGVTDSINITSRIASITIAGQVLGTPASVSGTDGYGFVSQDFATIKIGGNKISLASASTHTPIPLGGTGDFNLLEIAP